MPDDATRRLDRRRMRLALVAAAIVGTVSAYASLLSLATPSARPTTGTSSDATLVAALLIIVACAGITAAARPSGCNAMRASANRVQRPRGARARPDGPVPFRFVAHHCDCGRFADHVVRVAGRERCAGCLGMASGGIAGIGIAVALGAGLLFPSPGAAPLMVLVAAAASVGALVLLYLPRNPPALHAAANFALVAGTMLLTALLATHGLAAGVLGLSAALAVVGLRIEMSRFRHLSVYLGCPWREACRGASAVAASA